jgi:outer membrane protein
MTQSIPALRKIYIIALSFGLLTFSLKASAQQVISLQKAVDQALANNLTIKQAQFTEALDNETLQASKYNALPSVIATPQASYFLGRSINPSTNEFIKENNLSINGNLTAQVNIFQGGQIRNQVIQNKILLDADKTSTAKVKNDLILNVVTEYLTILTDQDLVIAAKQQLDIAHITLDRTQKNFDAGNQTLADLSQAKAQVSTAEYNITTAENQTDLAILALKQYMEMKPETQITIEKPDISKLTDIKTYYDPQEVLSTALTVNPDVKLAEVQAKAAEQGIKIAKGNYYPTLTLFGVASSNYTNLPITPNLATNSLIALPFFNQIGNNFNQSIGLSLNIPIFNKFTARTSVRKAKISYENSQLNAQIAKNNLSKIIYQAVSDLRAADKQYQSAQQTYQANKEAFNVTKQRYDVGLVNSLDYNTALTNMNKAQNDMINAQYQMVFRSKVIDYYLGNQITL